MGQNMCVWETQVACFLSQFQMVPGVPSHIFNTQPSKVDEKDWCLPRISKTRTLFIYLLLFRATPVAYGGSQAGGQIGAAAASFHHSHINAESLTHWKRPGIEHTSSCILVGFFSIVPQLELPPKTRPLEIRVRNTHGQTMANDYRIKIRLLLEFPSWLNS